MRPHAKALVSRAPVASVAAPPRRSRVWFQSSFSSESGVITGVTDRHTAVDYAQVLKELSDTHFPDAKQILLVQDNLNTHKPASLYQAFPAAEARRLVERFERHYTPKHGNGLDMAESELSVLSGQCLDRRVADKLT